MGGDDADAAGWAWADAGAAWTDWGAWEGDLQWPWRPEFFASGRVVVPVVVVVAHCMIKAMGGGWVGARRFR